MSLRRLIQENFWLKLFSLMLAIVIWFFVRFGSQTDVGFGQNPITNPIIEESIPVPVYVVTQPGDARIFKVSPEYVHITTMGESAILKKYTPRRDYKAYVDLAEIRKNEAPEHEVRLHVPNGVTVLNVAPRVVTVEQVSP